MGAVGVVGLAMCGRKQRAGCAPLVMLGVSRVVMRVFERRTMRIDVVGGVVARRSVVVRPYEAYVGACGVARCRCIVVRGGSAVIGRSVCKLLLWKG